MVKQISDNEIYLLIKYIKSVLWKAAKRLSYREEARCLKVNTPQAKFKSSKCCAGCCHANVVWVEWSKFSDKMISPYKCSKRDQLVSVSIPAGNSSCRDQVLTRMRHSALLHFQNHRWMIQGYLGHSDAHCVTEAIPVK